nr:hypothetical protein [Planctomycetota bacterium]
MRRYLNVIATVLVTVGSCGAAESVDVVEDRDPLPPGQPVAVMAPAGDEGLEAAVPLGDQPSVTDPVAGGGDAALQPAESEMTDRDVVLQEAVDLAASGHRARAVALLEDLVAVSPKDAEARGILLKLRIAERKSEMRAIVSAQADEKEFVLGDPGYEEAKARTPIHIARQLDLVEFLIQEQRFSEAVELCQRILEDNDGEEATMTLLDRLLGHLVRLEGRRLERERAVRRGEVVNDIIEAGTMPREPRPLARTVLIFDEDIAEVDRDRLMQQLRIKVGMINYQGQPLQNILQDLFALAGLNYVIRDDALGAETLTISLVDETVEHVLEVIQRMVPVQFNYRGGSVYVTSSDSPILVTEIVRLQAGLTDVLSSIEVGNGGGDDGGGAPQLPQLGGGDDAEPASDIERFLGKALDVDGLVSWPEGSTWYLDRKSNSLYIRSSPAAISEIKRLLHALDYNNVQVLIEARFVLVSTNAVDQFGVNWAMLGQETGSGDSTFYFGGAQEAATNPLGTGPAQLAAGLTQGSSGLRLGMLGVGQDVVPNFSVTLNALEQRGEANVFSEPKILTLNNSMGIINFSNDIAYVARYTNQSTGSNDTTVDNGTVVSSSQNVLVPEYEIEQEQIRLEVQPSVARNSDIITLFIHPNIRQFTGMAGNASNANISRETTVLGSGSIQQPEFQQRELAT